MGFTVPNFNITCNVWHGPNVPPAPPDATEDCNLAYGRRVNLGPISEDFDSGVVMTLLLPPGTDVRSVPQSSYGDTFEVPAGTGRFYTTIGVDDIGKGFPNEHRAAILIPTPAFGLWPTPYP